MEGMRRWPGRFIKVTNGKSFSVKKMRYWSLHQSIGRSEQARSYSCEPFNSRSYRTTNPAKC